VAHRDTKRVVIADAGPLIALARVEALYLFRDLFGRVCITTTVRNDHNKLLPAESTFADSDLLAQSLNED
jgi:predicted nucleic acid-binding protein